MVRELPQAWPSAERRARPRAPYPERDETDVVLRDGTPLHVRPIRWEDGPKLLDLYKRLSDESLYFRFFTVPKADPGKVEYLAHVDYLDHYALVAEKDDETLAVARFHRDAAHPDRAEVAFIVADAWQRRGIGTLLFHLLAGAALAREIAVFDAEVLNANEGMLKVFRGAGLPIEENLDGRVVHVTLHLGSSPAPAAAG